MDADVDGEFVFCCFLLEAQDEFGFLDRLAEGDCAGGVGSYVVGCFGEEEGFCVGGSGFLDQLAALLEVVGEGGCAAYLPYCLVYVRMVLGLMRGECWVKIDCILNRR